jgi:hypothetical protein
MAYLRKLEVYTPVLVVLRSTARIAFVCSNAGVVISSHTCGMYSYVRMQRDDTTTPV